MCGRYSLATPDPAALRDRFPLGGSVAIATRYNVAPGDPVLTVVGGDGPPHGELLRWGLVPFWAKDPKVGFKMINARAETLAERPAYREAFERRRCLVIADGFYEWEKLEDGRKQPWRVTRPGGEPFAFAGLWASWRGAPDPNERLRSCTIVTTQASTSISAIHDRMPVMLPGPDAEAAWLAPDASSDELRALLVPADDATLEQTPVSPAVNDARYDGPDCIVPVTLDGAAEHRPDLRLF